MSMREIRKKYTKSELVIMSWDSKQKAYNMSLVRGKKPLTASDAKTVTYEANVNGIRETATAYEVPKTLNNGVAIPKKFFNQDGEIDLRQATGPEALSYLRAVGVNIAVRF
jgi:hypothetical protein